MLRNVNGGVTPSSEQVSSNLGGKQPLNSSPQRGGEFADGRSKTSSDSLVFPQEYEIKHVIVSERETIQSIVNQNQLQENKYAPTSKSKISVLPQGVDMSANSLALCGRADLRTDGEKRVRIASRLSTLLRSNMYETLRAWSKFKTGQGEGCK